MFDNNEYYLPTKELYTLPSDADYKAAKDIYLASIDPHYVDKSDQEKWGFLIAQITDYTASFYGRNTQQSMIDAFGEFKKKQRAQKQTSTDLSLSQCNGYFEDFLFLLTTTNCHFCISTAAKKTLLQSLIKTMNACSTGIGTTFYVILQEHQKSTDWIKGELSKARCESIQLLYKKYIISSKPSQISLNTTYIHYYNRMVDLANRKNLGIKKKEKFSDFLSIPEKIDIFFEDNYENSFQLYETDLVETLTTYMLSEISYCLEQDSQEEDSFISPEQSEQLDQVLINHFSEEFLPADKLHCFLQESEDGSGKNTPFPKRHYKPIVQRWIVQKLIREGYFCSLDQLDENARSVQSIKLRGHISSQDLLDVYLDLKNNHFQSSRHHLYLTVFQVYPELVVKQIEVSREWLPYVPKSQLMIKDETFKILSKLLDQAIQDQNAAKITQIIHDILSFIDDDTDYIGELSKNALDHDMVASCLVNTNGLFWYDLSDKLKQNSTLLLQASTNHLMVGMSPETREAKFQESKQKLPSFLFENVIFASLEDRMRETPKESINRIARLNAYDQFIHAPSLSISEFLNIVPLVNPVMLARIIVYRKSHQLAPLPFCENASILRYLNQFDFEARGDDRSYWKQTWRSIRKHSYRRVQETGKGYQAHAYLAQNVSWFSAFLQFQAYHRGDGWRLQHIKNFSKYMTGALVSIALFLVSISVGLWLMPWIGAFWTQYYIPMTILTALSGLNYFWNNNFIRGVGVVGGVPLLIYAGLPLLVFFGAVGGVMALVYSLYSAGFLIQLGIEKACERTLARASDTWQLRCENILNRLSLFDDISAQQKLSILKELQTLMTAEPDDNSVSLIHKHYPISHQGKHYNMSFADVAARPRTAKSSFSLDPTSSSRYSLFACTTSSALMLSEKMIQPEFLSVPAL